MISLNNATLTPEVGAQGHQVAVRLPRPRARRGAARDVRGRAPADRLHLRGATKTLNELCSRCHSIGRVISERRTKDEWVGLMSMHRYFYPGIDGASGGFRQRRPRRRRWRRRRADAVARGAGVARRRRTRRQPAAVRESAGSLRERVPADVAGMGGLVGGDANAAARRTLGARRLSARQGSGLRRARRSPNGPTCPTASRRKASSSTRGAVRSFTRKSRAIVYTGFQWRGRSADAPDDPGTWREVAFIERNGQEIKGRWFTGAVRRNRHRRDAPARLERSGRVGHRRQLAEDVDTRSARAHLRRQSAGARRRPPTSTSDRASRSSAS